MDVVVDASAGLALCLPDETGSEVSALSQTIQERRAIAPALWPFEIANAISIALRRGRIEDAALSSVLASLDALHVRVSESHPPMGEVIRLAQQFGLTCYDAAYLEMAMRHSADLATLDTQLRDAAIAAGVPLVPGTAPSETVANVFVAGPEQASLRLDSFIAGAVEDVTRSYMQKLIKAGKVSVNGEPCTKPGRPMAEGDEVSVEMPPPPPDTPEPQDIPIDILYEDDHLVIVNKPAGLVVHPAPGWPSGTLVNAVMFHCKGFECPGEDQTRPGIVHRLDRDTSGVMVVAKTQKAFSDLARQAAEHTFDRRYLALVCGEFKESRGQIDAGIGRSLSERGKMAVTNVQSRRAVTNFEVLERFGVASLVALQLETGRTHQIRVHMRFAGRPVLGDPLYGVTEYKNWKITDEAREALTALPGQALHAERLGITHPATGERLTFTSPPPPQFQRCVEALRESASSSE